MRNIVSTLLELDKPTPEAVVAAPNSDLAPFDITVPPEDMAAFEADPEGYTKKRTAGMAPAKPTSEPVITRTSGRRNLIDTLLQPDTVVEKAQTIAPVQDEETTAQKMVRGALGVIDIPERVTKELVLPFTENIAGQAAGITDFASRAAFGTRGYIQGLIGTGSLEKAWNIAKKEAAKAPQTGYEPTTELGKKSLEYVGKGFEAVGELGKGAVRPVLETTKAPTYIKEPVEELAAFATYLLLPKAMKSATKTTKYVETLVEKGVDPLYLRDHLIRNGVDPIVAVGAEKLARQRGLTATVAERSLVEGDRPYVAKAKEAVGIKPGEERIVARLEPQTRGVKLGEEAKPAEPAGPIEITGPEPTPRPTGPDLGRQEIPLDRSGVMREPAGEPFVSRERPTELPFQPGEVVGRGVREGEGFTVTNAPVDTTPQLNWRGKPFKTEASAEKAALKAGIPVNAFDVVPSGEGFAFVRIDTRPRPINTTVKEEVPEVSKSDIMTEREITDPFTYQDTNKVEAVTPEVVPETPSVDTTSVLEKLLGLPESKPTQDVQSLKGKLGKIIEDTNEYSVTGEKIDPKFLEHGETFANTLSPVEQAKFRFGTTDKLPMVGFITPDGSGLDFGTGLSGNPRFAHGRMIQVYKDSRGVTAPRKALEDGMVRLAIDGKWDQGFFEVGGPLTKEQINFISDNWKDSGFNKIYLDYVPKILQDSRTIFHSESATAENIRTLLEDANKSIVEGKKEITLGPEKGIVSGSGLLYSDGTSKRLPAGHEKVEKTFDTLRTSTTDKEVVIDLTLGVVPTQAQLDAIEQQIGKKRDVRVGVYKPSGKYMTGGVVESPKDVTRFVNEAKRKTFPLEGTDGTILNSGFDPVAAVNALKATVEDVASLLPHLENLGKYIYEKGKTKYFEWQKEIKTLLGDLWKKFKDYIADVWKRVSSGKVGVLKNQRGAVGKDIKKTAEEYFAPISTRLGNIDPSLKTRVRKFEHSVGIKVDRFNDRVLPLIKATTRMDKADQVAFDLARKNGDPVELRRLVTKYSIGKEYHELRLVLSEMLQAARDAGYKVGKVPNYHPRELVDTDGFLEYMHGTDDWSTFDYAIKAKEKKEGYLSADEKAQIINTMLRGYSTSNVTLSKPGQLKARTVKEITPEIDKFYANSNQALLRYIADVTQAIEARKLFGVVKDKKGFDFDNTIGGYVLDLLAKKTITPAQERDITNILKARFNAIGTRGFIGVYKNASYIDTMGSPLSAITQIGDIAWTVYKYGIPSTVRSISKVVVGRGIATKKDVGIERIAAEFSDESYLAKGVDQIFKSTGLTGTDAVGKEAMMESAFRTAVNKTKTPKGIEQLRKELQPIFEGETDLVIEEFKKGKLTDNIGFYLFNTVSDFQPISLSEMPEKYSTGGNGRIFYMLKTFQLKAFDAFRNEAFAKIATKGQRIQGIRNLIKLAGYFVLLNAGTDVIQDFILGKPFDLPDLVVANLWKLAGSSRYIEKRLVSEGVGTALAERILPPFKFINALTKDIASFGDTKGFETVRSVPLVGEIYYWRFGKGKNKIEEKERKANKPITVNSIRQQYMPKLQRPQRPY